MRAALILLLSALLVWFTTTTTTERIQIGTELPGMADAPTLQENLDTSATIAAPPLAPGALRRLRIEKSVDGGEFYDATPEWGGNPPDISPGAVFTQEASNPHVFGWHAVDANDTGETAGHELSVTMNPPTDPEQ